MGAFYETIPDSLREWILKQHMLWVATAPLTGSGHINVSPKGGANFFGIIDNRTFWYHDLSGSGSETISHLHEPGNARICVMFSAFEGPPKIVRLWGKGRVLEYQTKEFNDHIEKYGVKCIPGTRSIIVVDVHQVGSSCGFSVPYYDFKEHRPILNDFFRKKAAKFEAGDKKESIDRYWAFKNAWSIDGLPGMKRGLETGDKENVAPIKKMVGPLAPKNGAVHQDGFTLEQVVIIFIAAFIAGMMVTTMSPSMVRNLAKSLKRETWIH